MANRNSQMHQLCSYEDSHLTHWKSLPNLYILNSNSLGLRTQRSLKDKRAQFASDREDTLVPTPFSPMERSKSMDYLHRQGVLDLTCEGCNIQNNEPRDLELSNFDLYLSKDFTDIMNTSFSTRSDLDSADANELDESLDAWTELQTSELTRSNITESLASRMYSYENLDRVGKSFYKINKWFQRCSFEDNDDATTNLKANS